MKEIKIVGNHTEKESHDLIVGLYHAVLKSDDRWHFFWEGPEIFVRFSRRYVKPVKAYLEKKEAKYTGPHTYKENIAITKKYLKSFEKIFHEYTLLRMKSDEDEFLQIADRITHCYININRRWKMEQVVTNFVNDEWKQYLFEATVLNVLASQRAIYIGSMLKMKEIENKED